MSAFVCSQDHIKALAIFAAHRVPGRGNHVDPRYFKHHGGDERMVGRPDHELATYYANILYCENIRSVQHRYPNDKTIEDLPGESNKPEVIEVTASEMLDQFDDIRLAVPPMHILSMCACLEYQSCETNDWRETLAFRLVHAIKEAAIRALPGYGDAPWEYTKPDIKRRRAA